MKIKAKTSEEIKEAFFILFGADLTDEDITHYPPFFAGMIEAMDYDVESANQLLPELRENFDGHTHAVVMSALVQLMFDSISMMAPDQKNKAILSIAGLLFLTKRTQEQGSQKLN